MRWWHEVTLLPRLRRLNAVMARAAMSFQEHPPTIRFLLSCKVPKDIWGFFA